jgi:hypothetical protein
MRRKLVGDPFAPTATRVAVDKVRRIPLKGLELVTLKVADVMTLPEEDRPKVRRKFVRLLADEGDPVDRAHAWATRSGALSVKVVMAAKPREISIANSKLVTEAIADLEGKSPHTTIQQVIEDLVAQTALDPGGKAELLSYCNGLMEQITLEGGADVPQDD